MKASFRLVLAFVVALLFGLLGVACEGGVNIWFENDTDHDLTVSFARPSFSPKYVDTFVVEARSKSGYSYPGLVEDDEVLVVQARDPEGNLVYSETLTLRDLKERGLRFVFRETVPLTPSPSPVTE
jgi:hypothetical protein